MKLCLKCQRKVTGNCYANRRKFTRSTWFTVHFPFLAEREKRIGDNCEMRIVSQRILRFLRFLFEGEYKLDVQLGLFVFDEKFNLEYVNTTELEG